MPLTRGGPCLVSGGLAHLLIHTAVAIAIKSVGCCRNHYQTGAILCVLRHLGTCSGFSLSLRDPHSIAPAAPLAPTHRAAASNRGVSLIEQPGQSGSAIPLLEASTANGQLFTPRTAASLLHLSGQPCRCLSTAVDRVGPVFTDPANNRVTVVETRRKRVLSMPSPPRRRRFALR